MIISIVKDIIKARSEYVTYELLQDVFYQTFTLSKYDFKKQIKQKAILNIINCYEAIKTKEEFNKMLLEFKENFILYLYKQVKDYTTKQIIENYLLCSDCIISNFDFEKNYENLNKKLLIEGYIKIIAERKLKSLCNKIQDQYTILINELIK